MIVCAGFFAAAALVALLLPRTGVATAEPVTEAPAAVAGPRLLAEPDGE